MRVSEDISATKTPAFIRRVFLLNVRSKLLFLDMEEENLVENVWDIPWQCLGPSLCLTILGVGLNVGQHSIPHLFVNCAWTCQHVIQQGIHTRVTMCTKTLIVQGTVRLLIADGFSPWFWMTPPHPRKNTPQEKSHPDTRCACRRRVHALLPPVTSRPWTVVPRCCALLLLLANLSTFAPCSPRPTLLLSFLSDAHAPGRQVNDCHVDRNSALDLCTNRSGAPAPVRWSCHKTAAGAGWEVTFFGQSPDKHQFLVRDVPYVLRHTIVVVAGLQGHSVFRSEGVSVGLVL